MSSGEVGKAFEAVGERVPGFKLREIVAEVDKNKDCVISFEEFLEVWNICFLFLLKRLQIIHGNDQDSQSISLLLNSL